MDDIFRGDKRIEPADESFSSALKKVGRGLHQIFFRRFYINLIILVILIIAVVAVTTTIKPKPIVSCPNITCKECPEFIQESCALQSCDDCPEKTLTEYLYRYICSNGAVVNASDACIGQSPITDPAYTSTANGISISFDGISYEKGANNTITIKQINYTILNQGNSPIAPKIGIKAYEKYTDEVKNAYYSRTFKGDDILGFSDWIRKSEALVVDVVVEGNELTVRLELINTIPDPDEYITTAFRKIQIS